MIQKQILLSVIGNSSERLTSYELIRILSRRFKITNYIELINRCIYEDSIERLDLPSKQMGSYKLTPKGINELKSINKFEFEIELINLYPSEKDFIKLLLE